MAVGGICLAVALLFVALDPGDGVRRLREDLFDVLLLLSPRIQAEPAVVVLDIDRDTLAAIGPWPWPRDKLAALLGAAAQAGPRAIGIDMLLAEREPPDEGDRRLAEELAKVPTALGIVLDPVAVEAVQPAANIAISGEVRLPDLLVTDGVALPAVELRDRARGLGVISLPADRGQPIRSVALLAGGGRSLLPGFAVETLRIAEGAETLILSDAPQTLRIGTRAVPLPENGLMRLHFSDVEARRNRTVSAARLLSDATAARELAGRIVLIGASAPEAGGLRLTAADPFMPSVEIEAQAVEQLLAGHVPLRLPVMRWVELAAAGILGALAIATLVVLAPARAALLVAGMSVAWMVLAVAASKFALRLTDPAIPVAVALFAFQGAGLAQFAATYRQRLAIERRFALHLPAEVVARIVENPDTIRFEGESRVVTALFTDIEGFTALTERAGPEAVIALLDRYVDVVAGVVIGHGGMVDKIVGDAVHAFFNAPLDLPDHPVRAVACARAILAATETLRRDPAFAGAGLGRTRIGVETGQAILGDVGRGAKRDYTAYGRVVNLSSRLEQANKDLGTSILVGPGTAAALDGRVPLRSLGTVAIKGISERIEVWTLPD